jgi:hypothetical protein
MHSENSNTEMLDRLITFAVGPKCGGATHLRTSPFSPYNRRAPQFAVWLCVPDMQALTTMSSQVLAFLLLVVSSSFFLHGCFRRCRYRRSVSDRCKTDPTASTTPTTTEYLETSDSLCFYLRFRVLFVISATACSAHIATRHFTGRASIERSLLLAFRLQFSPFCHVHDRCTNPFQVPRRVQQGRRRVDDAGRICSVCVQRRLFRGIIFVPNAVRSFATRNRLLLRLMPHPPNPAHCDPPSCLEISGCYSFVAQRRRRKTGSRKMSGSKTIIRSRPNREGK